MLKQELKQTFFIRISTTSFWLPLVIVFIAAATGWTWLAPESRERVIVAMNTEMSVVGGSQIGLSQERVEAELITIRPTGFEPTEIIRAEGPFILAVDNRSGLEEVDLQLSLEAGSRQREVLVHRKQLDWRDLVDLRPGRYVLKEVSHPDWACLITITGK